jgi:hypothetical protein
MENEGPHNLATSPFVEAIMPPISAPFTIMQVWSETIAQNTMSAKKAPIVFDSTKHLRETGCDRAISAVPDSISRLKLRMVPITAITVPQVKSAESPESLAIIYASPNW